MAKSYRGNKSRKQKRGGNQRDRNFERKGNPQDRDDRNNQCDSGGRTSSLNDLSWYSRNPNLLVAAGQFPYPYRPGMGLPMADVNSVLTQLPFVPGIMSLSWMPSMGNSTDTTDPISIAGFEFYGRVRAAYSGALDADAPDYITYIGALDSVFTYIGWLKRVYRAISTYTPENYDLPDGLLTAIGFQQPATREYLRNNKVRLWQGINEIILKSRKYKCPAVMDLFNRHYWMSDNVYADADSPRAQLYIFNLIGVYKLSDVHEVSSGDTITGLQMTKLPNLQASTSDPDLVQRLLNFGNSLLQALDAWDDGYTISGYLSRAFEGVPSFAVAELLQDELITVSYVPEVLMQIENSMTVAPAATFTADPNNSWMSMDVSKFIVTQNATTNAVVSSNEITVTINVSGGFAGMSTLLSALPQWIRPLLNVRSDAPGVADNVIATRLHACPTYALTNENKTLKITSVAGTEIPWQWNIFIKNGTVWEESPFWQVWSLNVTAVNSQVSLAIKSMLGVEQFDWHPFSFVVAPNGSVATATGISNTGSLCIMGDVYNATVVTVEMLANLHKICLYSELNSFGI